LFREGGGRREEGEGKREREREREKRVVEKWMLWESMDANDR
jgi:hypothetical protein